VSEICIIFKFFNPRGEEGAILLPDKKCMSKNKLKKILKGKTL
jgi:hypothetical protein